MEIFGNEYRLSKENLWKTRFRAVRKWRREI